MSHKKWGPFSPDDKRDDGDRHDPHADGSEKRSSAFDEYIREKFERPEYHRIRIGLKMLNRILKMLEGSWQYKNKQYTLVELENLLNKQHEIEKETERIDDTNLREYIFCQLDAISSERRHIAQEVRWDIECSKAAVGAASGETQE